MKRALLGFMVFCIVTAGSAGQDLKMYFDFETEPQPTFSGSLWQGVVANPLSDAVNPSDSVGFAKTGNNSWDGFTYNFPATLDLRTTQTFKMKVYHPTLQGRTRLQFGPGGNDLKLDVMYTTPGEWAELTWEIPDGYDGSITKVLLVFGHDRSVPDEEWYFDDLRGAPTYMAVGPYTYYSTSSNRKDWTGFDNAVYEGVVDNPDPDLTHDKPFAAKFLTGSTGWAGVAYNLAGPINFTKENTKFQMKVYSDSIGNARVQLEGSGATTMKISVPYTTPGEWAYLEFDPAMASAGDTSHTYTKMVLIFDDKDSDLAEEWYFDDLTGPGLEVGYIEPVRDYLNFETGENPEFVAFSGALYGGSAVNPLKDGVNGSDSVGVFFTGTEGWSAAYFNLPSTIDFSEGYHFKMKVYHPDSTGRARIWLEDPPNTKQIKVSVDYTTPGAWQELTFDMKSTSVEARSDFFTKVVLTFDDEDKDIGEEWYFDDLKGPALTPVYYNTGIFNITEVNTTASKIEIDINNTSNMIPLTEIGDTIWTANVPFLPVGDHVMDLYLDDVLVEDDVPFTIEETIIPTSIDYAYEEEVLVDALFKITVINSSETSFEIDINNGNSKITLYDDGTNGDATAGDNIWSILVNDLPPGSHVMDLYVGGVLKTDDVSFTLTEGIGTVNVEYTYDVTGLKEKSTNQFYLYPNPAQNYVTIKTNQEQINSIRIFNMLGKEVKKAQSIYATEYTMDISDLNEGAYFMRISGKNEIQSIVKLVIN